MIYDETGRIRIWLFVAAPFAFAFFLAATANVIADHPSLMVALYKIGILGLVAGYLRFLIMIVCAVAHKIGGGK